MTEKDFICIYKLRCSLLGHTQDVRAIAVSPEGDIVTTSRDKTAKLWREGSENSCYYKEVVTYLGHTGYVTSVCLIPGNEESASRFTVTGSKDSTILVFPRNDSEPLHTLAGHSDTVSCLAWRSKILVSGSWDNSIRVWKDWTCVSHLKGHSGPVWSIVIIEVNATDYLIISASADTTLKCWKDERAVVTYRGHTDCVRGVCALDSERFISCSNDASVRLWSIAGDCLATYYGHTSFIYSIHSFESSAGFVTGGEDRSLRIWDDLGNNTATIYLPAQSVWAVATLPNSDIVAGTSDGVCRVFTPSVDRQASTEEQSVFEESLAQFKVAVEDVGGIKKSMLPDKTHLLAPGKRDGQTVMVRDGDKVLCYNWSASKGEWEAVGEVVGGAGGSANTSGKVLHQGREYDFVFDVDLDEGRILKLPYNRGEDPWIVAQAFIHQNELPQDHLDQVANFITKNANVNSQSVTRSSDYFDPFTGGSRYVPSSSSGASSNRGTDPFTGSGGYVPPYRQRVPSDVASSHYFPQTIPLKFESVNKTGILSKLQESNSKVLNPLTEDQVRSLVDAVVSPSVLEADLAPLEIALKWPPEIVWPALDVLRLALRSESAHERWMADNRGKALTSLLAGFLGAGVPPATQLLSLRCLANMASHTPGRKALAVSRDEVLTAIASLVPLANKNIEIAAATLLINYCIIFKGEKDLEDQCQVLSASATLALSVTDSEAQFRTLVAVGTLLSCSKDIKSLALSLNLKPIIEKCALMIEPQKVGECARHVLKLFK